MTLLEMAVVSPERTSQSMSGETETIWYSLFDFLKMDLKNQKGDLLANPNKIMNLISMGFRPIIPSMVPSGISSLIISCWDQISDHRPTFQSILKILQSSTVVLEIMQAKHHTHQSDPKHDDMFEQFVQKATNTPISQVTGSPHFSFQKRMSQVNSHRPSFELFKKNQTDKKFDIKPGSHMQEIEVDP